MISIPVIQRKKWNLLTLICRCNKPNALKKRNRNINPINNNEIIAEAVAKVCTEKAIKIVNGNNKIPNILLIKKIMNKQVLVTSL